MMYVCADIGDVECYAIDVLKWELRSKSGTVPAAVSIM
jgi:hypothetical protein